MSFTPIFPIPDNYKLYIIQLQTCQRHCLNCNRPLVIKHNLCKKCHIKLLETGLEQKRITSGEVGRQTIPYQQYLHTSFFNCNVHYNYRGIKEDRIKARVKKQTLNTATTKIRNLLSRDTYTYQNKTYDIRTDIQHKFIELTGTPNLCKRLLYQVTLYYICYHINNKLFKSEAHFYASVYHNLLSTVRSRHCRITREKKSMKKLEKSKHYYYTILELNKILTPVLRDIANSIYN